MKKLVFLISFVILAACQEAPQEDFSPLAITSGDECHVCGMLITRLPGPKAQGIFDKQPIKFCSTRDMMSFYEDEENTHRVSQLFTQDMAVNDWAKPSVSQFIDAKTAWYVEGSSQTGGMGPTFASFANQADAQEFSDQYGGQVKKFTQLLNAQTLGALQGGHQH